jgi:Leucine-rich repeat (LRR) protein
MKKNEFVPTEERPFNEQTLAKFRRFKEVNLSDTPLAHPHQLFENLPRVEKLRIMRAPLQVCPYNIEKMALLTHLEICFTRIETLPPTLGNLVNLVLLNVSCNPDLVALPDSIGKLENLATLNVASCPSLGALPHTLSDCAKLESIVCNDTDPAIVSSSVLTLPTLTSVYNGYENIIDILRRQNNNS